MAPHLFLPPAQVVVRPGELGDYAGAMGATLLLDDGQAASRR
jgi:hypothetical protein